jgi:hypothetical protein
MSMQIKQSIDLNSIISGVHELVNYMEANIGILTVEKQPIIYVIYDTLVYMGVPDNVIWLAIGHYFEVITGDDLLELGLDFQDITSYVQCDFCGRDAIYLAPTPAGDKLAYEDHIKLITDQLVKQGIL